MINRFTLEDQIVQCWATADDIDLVFERVLDAPEPLSENDIANALLGISTLHNMRCQRLFETFTQLVKQGAFNETTTRAFSPFEEPLLRSKTQGAGGSYDEEDGQRRAEGGKEFS